MVRRIFSIGLAGSIGFWTIGACAESQVKVQGSRVNLRAKALPEAEVVGQVDDGTLLTAKSFHDDWVEVMPPDSIDLWVHRDFVSAGRVTADKLYIRGGPGINYTVVGSLAKDDVISQRGDFGEWIRIAPTPNTSLWINRSLVRVLTPEKPEAQPATSPSTALPDVSPPVAPPAVYPPVRISPSRPGHVRQAATETKPPAPPSDMELIPLEGQGRFVQREGVLRYVSFVFGRPSRYRLVRMENNRPRTICYIRGNNAQLHSFLGQTMLLRGREYWVKGVDDPVVIPEQIVPRAGAASGAP